MWGVQWQFDTTALVDTGNAHDWDHTIVSSGNEGITAVKVLTE